LPEAEAQWRRASLIRYRWLPVLTASSTLWILITLLSIVVGGYRRAQQRRLRERWEREEREERELDREEPWWLEEPKPPAPDPPRPAPPRDDEPD